MALHSWTACVEIVYACYIRPHANLALKKGQGPGIAVSYTQWDFGWFYSPSDAKMIPARIGGDGSTSSKHIQKTKQMSIQTESNLSVYGFVVHGFEEFPDGHEIKCMESTHALLIRSDLVFELLWRPVFFCFILVISASKGTLTCLERFQTDVGIAMP